MLSYFDTIPLAPDDPILSLAPLFAKDENPNKVNLGIGSYRTAEGRPYLLNTVAVAEKKLAASEYPRDYLPMEGDSVFLEQMTKLVFGPTYDKEKVIGIQTVGGTVALRLAADFIAHYLSPSIAVSNPTWPNHHLIFKNSKLFLNTYTYYSTKDHKVDFERMVKTLKELPPGSCVCMQSACHNPTGADLKPDEWKELVKIFEEGRLFPLFDNAYQGFGDSLDKDVYPIRLFLEKGIEMMVSVSCSKNFGLYGERVGVLFIVMHHSTSKKAILSQIKQNIRSIYSTPPSHGAKVVATILSDPVLKKDWQEELGNMLIRVQSMRENFAEGLISKSGREVYQFLMEKKGFFALLGISEEQVMQLRETKAIYMPANGRINIAGLTPKNLDYVIDSIINL